MEPAEINEALPQHVNAFQEKWESCKRLKKTESRRRPRDDTSDDPNAKRPYTFVRRMQPNPRPPEHQGDNGNVGIPVIGPVPRGMTVNEIKNRNRSVAKPMKVKLVKKHLAAAGAARDQENEPDLGAGVNENPGRSLEFDYMTCRQTCPKSGCRTIPVAYRRRIYEEFKVMTNDERNFVQRCLISEEDEQPNNPPRTYTKWTYHLMYKTKVLPVCRKTFQGTLGVSKSLVGKIQDKIAQDNAPVFFRDMTGRHDNRPGKVTSDLFEHVVSHLETYDKMPNHYSRARINDEVKFLDPRYTYSQLFNDYQNRNPAGAMKCSITTFRNIMKAEGYFIGVAYNDTCATCDRLEIEIKSASTQKATETATALKDEHLTKVEWAFQARKDDITMSREKEQFVCLTVDLEQTIFTPQLSSGPSFYCRKFASYNFGIHDEKNGKASMLIWHEVDGKRGADEVASLILHYVTENYEQLRDGQIRELSIWSDRCAGQNNNYTMAVLYRKLIQMGYFTCIDQKFAVSGHSYLSPDRDFALVEKTLRRKTVKCPTEIPSVIRSANPEKFTVEKINRHQFLSFEEAKTSCPRPETLKVSQCFVIRQLKEDPLAIYTKPSHDPAVPFEKHEFDSETPPLIPNINTQKYTKDLRLKKNKKQDLLKLMKFLTPNQRQYLWSRIQPEDGDNGDDSDGEDGPFAVGYDSSRMFSRHETMEEET